MEHPTRAHERHGPQGRGVCFRAENRLWLGFFRLGDRRLIVPMAELKLLATQPAALDALDQGIVDPVPVEHVGLPAALPLPVNGPGVPEAILGHQVSVATVLSDHCRLNDGSWGNTPNSFSQIAQ